ncbi:MAG: NAD-dependent dehydratase [Gammaproteobacteria bacterium]|nr:NAD-dependent dehydratase [Gammaproteobacteria bacterium]
MKTTIVTGCAGFIGSHLTDYLLKKKHKIIGIDNLLTGDEKNIQHLKENKDFKFINHDICKSIDIDDEIDNILHFASTASPIDYLKYPIRTLQIGSIGTERILKLALKKNATVLVASTSEIYGDPLEHPQTETYFGNVNPIGPRGVYDEAKRYLEAITMAYHSKMNLNTKIVRIFNTFGPRMRVNDGRAIPNFINQAISGEDITIYGNGKQTRSFCYINDTIDGIYKLLNSKYSHPVNIGNPVENSILELVEIIKKLIKTNSKISFKDLPENDPKTRKPDITLAKNLLNWEPKVSLVSGLIKTIDYFSKDSK